MHFVSVKTIRLSSETSGQRPNLLDSRLWESKSMALNRRAMTVSEATNENEISEPEGNLAKIDQLKKSAKGLEKSIGGAPIESDVIQSVVKAIQQCDEIPDQLIRALTLVITSNAVYNYAAPKHAPFAILRALGKHNFPKTFEYTIKSFSQLIVLPSTNRTATRGHLTYVRKWILMLLNDGQKQIKSVEDVLLIVASISFHQSKRASCKMLWILRKFDETKFFSLIDLKLSNSAADAPRIMCFLALLSTELNEEQEHKFKNSTENNSSSQLAVSKLWLKTLNTVYFANKTYPGDSLFLFNDGYNVLKYVGAAEFNDAFCSSIRKSYLRVPEVALPTLKLMFKFSPSLPIEFVNFVGEMVLDTLSSANDKFHEYAATVLVRVLFYSESTKQKKLLDILFGKQSKTKSRPQYADELRSFLLNLRPDFTKQTNVTTLVENLLAISESELTSAKTDVVAAPFARIFSALSSLVTAENVEKYVDVSLAVLKKAPNNFPITCTSAVSALATTEWLSDKKVNVTLDLIKQHLNAAIGLTVSADFTFFLTLLLMKLSRHIEQVAEVHALLVQLLTSDAFMKDKFLTNLSSDAVQFGWLFVKEFVKSTKQMDTTNLKKLPQRTAFLRFLLLLLEWPEKVPIPTSYKHEDILSKASIPILSWILTGWTEFVNNNEFSEAYFKLLDAHDPHNISTLDNLFVKSAVFSSIPKIITVAVVDNSTVSKETLANLVFQGILLANNAVKRNEKTLRNFAMALLNTEPTKQLVFETLFDCGIMEVLYELNPLKCRQNTIGFLVALESENSRHRDYAWQRCITISNQIDLKKLNDVTETENKIFFTAEGVLCNTAVIDENSDATLDGKQNLRRENKAYKFKDQIAEIELRKELAEKNKREGKLTPRQQEAVKRELAKESDIRRSLNPFYLPVKALHEILPVILRNDPNGALKNYEIFYDRVVPALRSHLVAKLMAECVTAYRDVFFSSSSDFLGSNILFGFTFVYSGERALSSLFRASRAVVTVPEWSWEPFTEQLSKFVTSMNLLSLMNTLFDEQNAIDALEQLRDEELNEDAFNEGLTLGKLAFSLPILERVFTDTKMEQRLCSEITNFLKSAFALDFLTVEEREWTPMKLLNKLLLDTLCNNNNLEYFEDVFELLKAILKKLDEENSKSENVGNYVKMMISQLRNPNEYVREHIGILLMVCQTIIAESCVKQKDLYHLSLLVISSNEQSKTHRQVGYGSRIICEKLDISPQPEMHNEILTELGYPYEFWQVGAARTLCPLFNERSIIELEGLYRKLCEIVPALKDQVGRIIMQERDQWAERRGVAIALQHYISSTFYNVSLFEKLLQFLVPDGIADDSPIVRKVMYETASTLISMNGADKIDFVLPLLEKLLTEVSDTEKGDILRNGLVCLMGTLARYLEPESDKLKSIFIRLIGALSVPSRQVQQSVAVCLPPLTQLIREEALKKLRTLMEQLPKTKIYGERCGFAYGIAGLTKGLGLVCFDDIKFLPTMMQLFVVKEAQGRESACILFMTIIHRRAFDPYIIKLLPLLIQAFGDSDDKVRESARTAGAVMMKNISPTGVKMFLPEILAGLNSESWRAKCASADFLANISNCAPSQLSESLPKVVPELATLMTDSHIKVRNAGIDALRQIATVITNPEILSISSHLIAAFIEPAKETTRALQIIVNTKFIHFIDPPALALIMPILKRALNDREPDGRRMAANVVTNVFSIADEKDVEPYMDMLVPNLKHSLLDPDPKARSAAAQAIGAIVHHNTSGVFTSYTTDLIPWLKEHMVSRSSMVDRMGAAQGMAEVISAFQSGTELVINQAIAFTMDSTNDPAMRDGYIRLFTYLPSTLGDRFIPYIERVIPSILASLADETEYLRNSALHTGQILISTYCSHAKRHLLPSLLDGVINESWRIRHAAVTLIGDFLFNISGISSKMTSDTNNEDDTFGMESVNKTIVRYVGQKARDRIIVSLYMARFDAGVQVRQAASHVWKLVVSNTPRTVKDSLPALFDLIVYCVSTSTEDRRTMAVECLGEVIRKLGERIMESLMPEVQAALEDERLEHRRGAMEALSVIIVNASSETFDNYNKLIIKAFRRTLCDRDHHLRQIAGEAFAVYHNKVGVGALEDIVDPMFKDYAENEAEEVLDGIVAILSVNRRGRVLTIPSLVGRILKFRSKAYVLSRLSAVIGDTIERSFLQIFTTLLNENTNASDEEFVGHCNALLHCLQSTYTIVGAFKFFSMKGVEGNILAAQLMTEMVRMLDVREDLLNPYVDGIMTLYCSENQLVVTEAVKLLMTLINKCSADEAMEIPTYLSSFAVGARDEKKTIHGLNQPGSWRPFSELMSTSSRTGSLIQRERTVRAVADLLEFTTVNAILKPVVPSIVAILLRLLADQCPATLKFQAVRTVKILVDKVPDVMRAFAPQLMNFMNRLLQEYEEDSVMPDISTLLELTRETIGYVKELTPNRS
ncbi:TOG domain-containing protein [Aphelenchoides besseyi]|nr:TOG domain-containing protein [Aphelenchoides besseyi]